MENFLLKKIYNLFMTDVNLLKNFKSLYQNISPFINSINSRQFKKFIKSRSYTFLFLFFSMFITISKKPQVYMREIIFQIKKIKNKFKTGFDFLNKTDSILVLLIFIIA